MKTGGLRCTSIPDYRNIKWRFVAGKASIFEATLHVLDSNGENSSSVWGISYCDLCMSDFLRRVILWINLVKVCYLPCQFASLDSDSFCQGKDKQLCSCCYDLRFLSPILTRYEIRQTHADTPALGNEDIQLRIRLVHIPIWDLRRWY